MIENEKEPPKVMAQTYFMYNTENNDIPYIRKRKKAYSSRIVKE